MTGHGHVHEEIAHRIEAGWINWRRCDGCYVVGESRLKLREKYIKL